MVNLFLVLGNTRFALEFESQLKGKNELVFRIPNPLCFDLKTYKSVAQEYTVIWANGSSRSDETKFVEYEKEFLDYLALINALEGRISHLYISSGGAMYATSELPVNEDTITSPVTAYALNKEIEEKKIIKSCRNTDAFYVFRLANVYGSNFKKGRTGLISKLEDMIDSGNPSNLIIRYALESERQYGTYEDYARNILSIISIPQLRNKIINLSPPAGYKLEDILKIFTNVSSEKLIYQMGTREETSRVDTLKLHTKYEIIEEVCNWTTLESWVNKRFGKKDYHVKL